MQTLLKGWSEGGKGEPGILHILFDCIHARYCCILLVDFVASLDFELAALRKLGMPGLCLTQQHIY